MSLRAYLILYCKARKQLYLDYMYGFRLLVEWLGPVEDEYAAAPVAWFAGNYEVQQLATILEVPEISVINTLQELFAEGVISRG